MEPTLVLLASYPKSGNTWTRIILQGLLDARVAGDMNAVDIGLYGKRKRMLFDEFAPADAADLLPREIDDWMPWVNTRIANELPSPVIVKTHEKARRNRAGQWLYPPECVRAVLYLVRHPFDVAASFANHMGYSAERVVAEMRSPFWFAPQDRKAHPPLPEFVDSWSANVGSWIAPDLPYPCTVIRYEDILQDDLSAFRLLAVAAGVPFTEDELQRVVQSSRFEKLQAQESKGGFREKPEMSSRFFRSGKPMSWQGVLSDALCADLARDHADLMSRFGYVRDGSTIPMQPQAASR